MFGRAAPGRETTAQNRVDFTMINVQFVAGIAGLIHFRNRGSADVAGSLQPCSEAETVRSSERGNFAAEVDVAVLVSEVECTVAMSGLPANRAVHGCRGLVVDPVDRLTAGRLIQRQMNDEAIRIGRRQRHAAPALDQFLLPGCPGAKCRVDLASTLTRSASTALRCAMMASRSCCCSGVGT